MNAQELAELDLAVAKAEGFDDAYIGHDAAGFVRCLRPADRGGNVMYWPSNNSVEAMRLLMKYGLYVAPRTSHDGDGNLIPGDHGWLSGVGYITVGQISVGETPCIAICRAVVALKGAV